MTRELFEQTQISIVEIFQSISGEGISAGSIVVFVRVAGCNLRCTWCDTKYSFNETGEGVRQLLPSQIVDEVIKFGSTEIICTGGEPLEEGKTKRLLPLFLAQNGYKVRIETSGASNLFSNEEISMFPGSDKVLTYCMDVKCPGSGMVYQNNLKNITKLKQGDELKFVVKDQTDLKFCCDVIDAYKNHLSTNKIALNFSPVFDAIEPVEIVDFLKTKQAYFKDNELWARLSLQLHKYVWAPFTRGV